MCDSETISTFLSGVVLGHIIVCTLFKKCRAAMNSDIIDYHGSCHCRNIQFIVKASRHLVVWKCDCTICDMKKNWHFVVPKEKLTLLCDESALQEYTFGTHTARHLFCKKCGVQAFYVSIMNCCGMVVTLWFRAHDRILMDGL